MLSEKDKSVIYSMCLTGMSLDVLKKSFPQFDGADIETIFNEYNNEPKGDVEEITISCNCS